MKLSAMMLVMMAILAGTSSVVLAKPEPNTEVVCWINNQGQEQWAEFMTTGSGIIHRFKDDGQHDIYKPASRFRSSEESTWKLWTAKQQKPCDPPTTASVEDFLNPGEEYWHRNN